MANSLPENEEFDRLNKHGCSWCTTHVSLNESWYAMPKDGILLCEACGRGGERKESGSMPNLVQDTLDTRETTHGSFVHRSRVCNNIRQAMLAESQFLEPDQTQALIMIADKVSRIVCGKANTHDHWLDIAGYAMLVADRITRGIDGE